MIDGPAGEDMAPKGRVHGHAEYPRLTPPGRSRWVAWAITGNYRDPEEPLKLGKNMFWIPNPIVILLILMN